jgi:DNA-binding SARP family transcriptional activator
LRYEILGPLRIVDERGTSFIRTQKAETLLAVLLIRFNQVVTKGQLMTEIWGEHIPRRASACIHVYISQLRKFLDRPARRDSPIMTMPPGYLLSLGSDELDLNIFQDLAAKGRSCAREGRHEEAVTYFEEALSLWRGTMLEDMDTGPIMDGFATWLDELRMECIEMSVDSQLEIGHHRELIGRLYSLTAEYPLRESFYRQLMLALYRAERQADALGVYQSARRKLHDELGLEPCRALQELHHAVLTADSRLDVNAAAPLELQRA